MRDRRHGAGTPRGAARRLARGAGRAFAGALVVVIALTLAACGDDSAGTTEAVTVTERVTVTDGAATTPGTTTATGTSTTATTAAEVDAGGITRALQKDLAALGFYDGPQNGRYDAATRAAVRAIQAKAGLARDGIAGPQTHAAIDLALGRRNSNAVKLLQGALAGLCVYSGPVDGVYGSATEAALRDFQESQGLAVDGKVGPATATALATAYASRPASCGSTTAAPDATATAPSTGTTVTVQGPSYGPKTFEVATCTNAGETDIDLTATAAGGFTLTMEAENGTGTIALAGGNEQDGIRLNGTITSLSVGDAGDIRATGTFTDSGRPRFVVVGRCA